MTSKPQYSAEQRAALQKWFETFLECHEIGRSRDMTTKLVLYPNGMISIEASYVAK